MSVAGVLNQSFVQLSHQLLELFLSQLEEMSGVEGSTEPGAGRRPWPREPDPRGSAPPWLRETRRRLEANPLQAMGPDPSNVIDRWEAYGERSEELIAEARRSVAQHVPGASSGLASSEAEEEALSRALLALAITRRSLELKSLWFDVPGSTTVVLGRPVQVHV